MLVFGETFWCCKYKISLDVVSQVYYPQGTGPVTDKELKLPLINLFVMNKQTMFYSYITIVLPHVIISTKYEQLYLI